MLSLWWRNIEHFEVVRFVHKSLYVPTTLKGSMFCYQRLSIANSYSSLRRAYRKLNLEHRNENHQEYISQLCRLLTLRFFFCSIDRMTLRSRGLQRSLTESPEKRVTRASARPCKINSIH